METVEVEKKRKIIHRNMSMNSRKIGIVQVYEHMLEEYLNDIKFSLEGAGLGPSR